MVQWLGLGAFPVGKMKVLVDHSCPPWTVGSQAPLSVEFSKQEYWSEKKL